MKTKRLLALLLTLLTVLSLPCNVFAAASTNDVVAPTAVASDYFLNDAGTFNTAYVKQFTVPSKTLTSVIVSVKGVNVDDDVSVRLYPTDGRNVYVLDKIVSYDSAQIWQITLPANTYELMLIGGSGTYAYSVKAYPY